ncbi:MAG: amino acid adenylation domain-containing protein, partial [bacterium]|nr:amino acid adenylation domain-containing protein [bacterium]
MIEDIYPLSDIQEGMVFHSLRDAGLAVYHNQRVFRLEDRRFDPPRLQKALSLMTGKHPILRTSFNMYDYEEPVQVVLGEITPDYRHIDLSGLSRADRETRLEEFKSEDRRDSFDFSGGAPLWRLRTFDLGNGSICFLWVSHHAILDGWSCASLLTELNNTYEKLKTAPHFVPLPLEGTYKDFIIQQMVEKKDRRAIQFWKKELAGYKRLDLSFLRDGNSNNNTSTETQAIKKFSYHPGENMAARLKQTALEQGTTVKHLCFAAYLYMLNMFSFDSDMLVGLVTGSRPVCPDGDKILGCFLNTVPVRLQVPPRLSWVEYARLTDQKLKQLKKYERLPLFEILRVTGEETSADNPLFDTTFNFMDFHIYGDSVQEDETVREAAGDDNQGHEITGNLLDMDIAVTLGRFRVTLSYHSFIDDERIQTLSSYFASVLEQLVSNPHGEVSKLEIMSEPEREKVLDLFNRTQAPFPARKTVSQLFEEQAQASPGSEALVYKDQRWTYTQLNNAAANLAGELTAKGAGPGTVIAVMLDVSMEMMPAVMGILKSGSAYLPIDPAYPAERIHLILRDSGARLLVTTTPLAAQLNEETKPPTILVDSPEPVPYSTPSFSPSSPAYVIYTSGSQGRPKGILIEQEAFTEFTTWAVEEYEHRPGYQVLLSNSYAFDSSLQQMFPPLASGGTLHLLDPQVRTDSAAYLRYLKENKINNMDEIPVVMNVLLESIDLDEEKELLPDLTCLSLGSEYVPIELVRKCRRYLNHTGRIINGYGPAEASVETCTYHFDGKDETERSLVGKPRRNINVYILDSTGQYCPIGAAGEICVSGVGLARGYLNNPGMTMERFVDMDFSHGLTRINTDNHGRVYCTGDQGRWMPDGNVDFLGRLDHQVKIRGYRIELSEIEDYILKFTGVTDAVVLARTHPQTGDKYLCAYVVPVTVEESKLKEYLTGKMPNYMVPSQYVSMERFPLNPNGKVDRKALPEPGSGGEEELTPPRNPLEETLVEIWADVLGLEKEKIGIDSDFFQLGGHSLKATLLAGKIHKQLNIKIPLAEIFRLPTVGELAGFARRSREVPLISIENVEEKEYYELSSAQKQFFFLQQLDNTGISYNISFAFELSGKLDIPRVETAIQSLIRRHESFRTSFATVEGEPVQVVHDAVAFEIECFGRGEPMCSPLIGNNSGSRTGLPLQAIRDFIRPFDLAVAPLVRVGVIQTAQDEHIVIMDMHHIISDDVTIGIFGAEFLPVYKGESLAPLRFQYKDYSRRQNDERNTPASDRHEAFWLAEFGAGEEIPLLNLPTDYPRPAVQNFEGSSIEFSLDPEETRSLKALALHEEVTLFMLMLALYNVFLSRVTNQETIHIGTSADNRRHPDLEHIIGVFLNTLVLRNQPEGEKTFLEFLADVKQRTIDAYAHQDYPYEDLIDALQPERNAGRNLLFDTMFNFQDTEIPPVEIPGLELKLYEFQRKTSKFDLRLTTWETGEQLFSSLEYSTGLFTQDTVNRFVRYFKQIVSSAVDSPGSALSELQMISEEEKQRLVYDFNDTRAEFPSDKTLHQLFMEQAEKTPGGVAVSSEGEDLTFGRLNEKSNRLAAHLMEKGVGPGMIVAIMMNHSIEMIIGIFGILKAGAAYLPIDPEYPKERVDFMLGDSNAIFCIPDNRGTGKNNDQLSLENSAPSEPSACFTSKSKPSDLAYIIYTSGSTGNPKGVLIEHRSIVNYITWSIKNYANQPAHFPLFTSLSFDLTATSIFTPLLSGNTVIIYKTEGQSKEPLIGKILRHNQVGVVKLTPSHLKLIWEQYLHLDSSGEPPASSIHCFIVGGEAFDTRLADGIAQLFGSDVAIYNEYGPTEATVGCMIYRHLPGTGTNTSVPIGVPADNARIYLLDRNRVPVPVGVAGEIYISGVGVARGYLNRPLLTMEKFLPDPFLDGQRMYRSGDLARFLADGNIQFLGRIDHQVKIRGFRIEPGEIETKLTEFKKNKPIRQPDAAESSPGDVVTILRCRRCLLSTRHPGIQFDETGLCNTCREYEQYEDKLARYFKSSQDFEQLVREDRESGTNGGKYDCLLLFSGGKDSTYVLYRLKDMGLNVLTFTFDNGYISDAAFDNIKRTTSA